MIKLFLRIYDTLAPRRRLVGGVVCLLVLLCGVLAGRMAYDEDISAFMPLDEETAKYAEVFNKLGGQERVVVIFEDEGQPDFSTLEAAMTVFGESVERRDTARLAKNLQVRVDEQGMLETLEGVWRTYPLLLNEEDYARLDTLLADAAYPARQMDRNRQALMLPTGGFVARSLPYDPLNMSGGVTNRLRSLNVGDAYQTIDGYLFKDSVGLVMLESPFGISESGNNQRLQALLDSCMADVRSAYPSLSVSAVGAPLIAVTNAERIKADSLLALGLSVTLILLILLYAFRRVGDLLWVGVSVFVGWLFALGAIALAREGISLIVIGIGSVIIGIAVNYPLHFIEHLKHETDMREALKEMVSPLLVGNITTVSAFLCLVALDAKAMRDLGLFGSLTLVGTILFVLICLPLFLKPRGETRPEGGFSPGRVSLPRTGPGRRVAFWVVAGLTVVFGYFSTGTSFDSDMRNINYMLPEQREGLRFLASTLESEGDSARTLYAVAEGRTLDEALRRSEALVEEARGVKGVGRIVGITGLLPSDSSRERRIAQWSAFWTRHAAARDGLARAATAAGFSPTAFEPFGEMVERPAETLAGDLSQSPLYDLVGSHFILRSDSVYRVVNFVRAEGQLAKGTQCMGGFQCRDDTFEAGQFVGGIQCFIVVDGENGSTLLRSQMGMQRPDARIVQSGGNRVGLFYLSVFVLNDVGACPVDDANLAQPDGGSGLSGFYPFSTGFCKDDALYPFIVYVVIDGAGGIASATYAGDEAVGIVAPLFFQQLFLDFRADDRLQACHHVRIGVGAYGGADDVVGVGGVAAPVAYGFVGGVFQCHIARCDGDNRGT